MTQNQEMVKEPRVNISITGYEALAVEQLRSLLEKRFNKRFSLAQVIKRITVDALANELKSIS